MTGFGTILLTLAKCLPMIGCLLKWSDRCLVTILQPLRALLSARTTPSHLPTPSSQQSMSFTHHNERAGSPMHEDEYENFVDVDDELGNQWEACRRE